MLPLLSRCWWVLVLRGIAALVFGIAAFAWPGLTLATLILFFGAWALVNGFFLIISALAGWSERDDRWIVFLEGLLGIVVGVTTFRAPEITAYAVLLVIAVWSFATGLLEVIAAIRLRKEIEGEFWLALGGVVSILFAVLLMWFPGAGALGFLWLIASYAMVFGLILLTLGFKLRKHRPKAA